MKKILFSAIAMALSMSASAQQLIVECNDTALTNSAQIAQGLEMKPASFVKGKFTYSVDTLKTKESYALFMDHLSKYYVVLLEPGKTLSLKISTKKGKTTVDYKGENAPEARLFNAFTSFEPGKNSQYELRNQVTDTLSYEQAFEQVHRKYAELKQLAQALPVAEDRQHNLQDIELKYLDNQIQLYMDRDTRYGKDIRQDVDLMKVIGQINPNDPKFLTHDLIGSYLLTHMSIVLDSNTMKKPEVYGIDYLKTTRRYLQNQEIRNLMNANTLNALIQADGVDLKALWPVALELADTAVTNPLQYIVDARLSTQSGQKCPDVTFSDAQGKQHRLSDYFGKVLYIDLWATWCGPCQMEIPEVAKLVEHYKDNDQILFISISMDRNRNAWLKQIGEEKPAWPQFNTSKEEDKVLTEQWGVASIPRFLIINADGTINSNDAFRPSDADFVKKMDAIIQANAQ